jgi:hypothetical protein
MNYKRLINLPRKPTRLQRAIHEAGHAVVGLALKLPVAFVTIKSGNGSLGYTSQAPVHNPVGLIHLRGARGTLHKSRTLNLSNQDAFGNRDEQANRF